MTDREVSAGCLAAYGSWASVFALIILAWLLDNDHIGQAGLAMSAVAATATIRCYFVRHNRMLRHTLDAALEREQARPVRIR